MKYSTKPKAKTGSSMLLLAAVLFFTACNSGTSSSENNNASKDDDKKEVKKTTQQEKADSALFTIAGIRNAKDGKSTEVFFYESERVFTFSKEEKDFALSSAMLQDAFKANRLVKVAFNLKNATVMAAIKPSVRDMEVFSLVRKNILKGEASRVIDISKIDTATFNQINLLQWPVFRLCRAAVPDYATAKKIFDTCAAQSCNLGVPTSYTPCIPFQYVIDGCYARAHKMRYIIENKFRYCSQKVFSYGYVGNDKLAVQANKWGGCCVEWWYHVAPIINVKINIRGNIFTMAYVIDPGMFTAPVLLSTWLAAQENKTCNANAHVSMYSIQPSSAYTPSYPPGSYATDPNYTATNNTLISYANGVTCH
jgi:hypothetical protein